MTNYANRGRGFEDELEQTHACYARMGKAWLARFHVPKVLTRKGIVYTARTWCDLSGFLADGRAVLLEAKSMQAKHTWKPDREHQLKMLQTARRCGALGLYVIRVGINEAWLWRPPLEYVFGEKINPGGLYVIQREYHERAWPWLEKVKELNW